MSMIDGAHNRTRIREVYADNQGEIARADEFVLDSMSDGHARRNTGSGWIERGYWYICIDGRKIAFHRWVVEQMLGHPLSSHEIVHHVDGNQLNNDPANLVILTRAEHTRIHSVAPRRRISISPSFVVSLASRASTSAADEPT